MKKIILIICLFVLRMNTINACSVTIVITGNYCSFHNGAVNVTPSGGTIPYTYSWTGPSGYTSTSQNNSGLVNSGTYNVTVTDNVGCTKTGTISISQPGSFLATTMTTIQNETCFGQSIGIISANPTGGFTPYSYIWSPTGGTQKTASNLSAVQYTVTVTDSTGCVKTNKQTPTQPSDILVNSPGHWTQTNLSCYQSNDGIVEMFPAGGNPGYTYLWSPGGATTATISSLSAGTYNVTVTDVSGCTKIVTPVITQPTQILLTGTHMVIVNDTPCYGATNGKIMESPSGGVTPYTYLWSPGGATTATITGLGHGNYTVTVTDHISCTATAIGTVGPTSVLSANMVTHTNVACYGGSTGLLAAVGGGGTSPYSYLWSNSATTGTISGLTIGTYGVTVTDHNGCTATNTATISQPASALTATLSDTVIYSVGIAVITAGGGTSPYTYLWSPMGQTTTTIISSMFGGNSVVVTDAHGCTVTLSQTINLPDTETIGGVTAFYPNLGQIIDTRDSVSTKVKFYTMRDYPKNYFIQDTICYVFTSKVDTTTHTDTLQRIALSFNRGNTTSPISLNRVDSGGVLNYFLPQCPAGITGVHANRYILYPEIYNHVEAVFSGNSDGSKYYIVILPGADTSMINLQYNGADSIELLASTGEMAMIDHFHDTLFQAVPEVYQMDSSGGRVNLAWASSYYSPANNQIKFHLGVYDTNIPLIIQLDRRHHTPLVSSGIDNLDWTTYIGSPLYDHNTCITTDNVGNAYFGGSCEGENYPVVNGIQSSTGNAVNSTVVLTKFDHVPYSNSTYGNIDWSTYYGGTTNSTCNQDYDFVYSIAVNNTNGNVYAVGSFQGCGGSDFPLIISTTGTTTSFDNGYISAPYRDGYILKLNSAGNGLWCSAIGGANDEVAIGVAINQTNGDVYVVGETSSTGITSTLQASTLTSNSYNQNVFGGGYDAFLMKFDHNDNILWSTVYGGESNDEFDKVSVLPNGNIVICGYTESVNSTVHSYIQSAVNNNTLDICNQSGSYNQTYNHTVAVGDILLAAFNTNDELIWSSYFGGSNKDYIDGAYTHGNAIASTNATSSNPGFYITGTTRSSNFPVTSTNFKEGWNGGTEDAIVARFDNNFARTWCSFFGGTRDDNGNAITVDKDGVCYIGGSTSSSTTAASCVDAPPAGDFPTCNSITGYYEVGWGGLTTTGNSYDLFDSYIAAFSPDNHLVWSTYMNGHNNIIEGLSAYSNVWLYFSGGAYSTGTNNIPQLEYPGYFWNGGVLTGSMQMEDLVIGRFYIIGSDYGINDISKKSGNGLHLYPNPANDLLQIEDENINGEVQIEIDDMVGQVIYRENYNNIDKVLTLNIKSLIQGCYMVKVKSNNNIAAAKFIKM